MQLECVCMKLSDNFFDWLKNWLMTSTEIKENHGMEN